MDYTKFSKDYQVHRLSNDDIPLILALCEKNPQFYEHCPPFVTVQSIKDDMQAMPQRKIGQEQDKYYLGYFDKTGQLAAVMDFVDHYPDEQSCFIRLGYVDSNEQSKSFWQRNQFTDTGLRNHTDNYTVVVMNRSLNKQ